MAVHTAATFIVLSTGILVARPDRGIMAVLTRDSVGGVMARRVVPAAIGLPLALGWLRWEGQQAGLYGTAFGVALIVIAHIVVFTAFAWWTAGSLDRTDVARRQAEAAAAARARLAAIVEASEDAIIGKTLDGTITSWNPAAARLYGYSAAEAIGHPISLLVPPDHRDQLAELLARVAQGESIPHFETERLRKDGTRLAVSVSIAPVRAASGAVVAAAAVARDITLRKRAEEALHWANANLEKASQAKSEFLATMSHEIRTPMNGVIGLTSLLLGTPLSPEQQEYVTAIQASGDALLTLIDDILDLSKIEAGHLSLEVQPLDLRQFVGEVVAV